MMHVAHFCLFGGRCIAFAENLLDALFNLTTRQQHTPAAPLTLQPNVSAQAYDSPVGAATRMRLAQPHAVIQSEVRVFHVQPPPVLPPTLTRDTTHAVRYSRRPRPAPNSESADSSPRARAASSPRSPIAAPARALASPAT